MEKIECANKSNDERPVLELRILIEKLENSQPLNDIEKAFLEDLDRLYQWEESIK